MAARSQVVHAPHCSPLLEVLRHSPSVHARVGDLVGVEVGAFVGAVVGALVGDVVGAFVGSGVGC